jgi:hypothetical protein
VAEFFGNELLDSECGIMEGFDIQEAKCVSCPVGTYKFKIGNKEPCIECPVIE